MRDDLTSSPQQEVRVSKLMRAWNSPHIVVMSTLILIGCGIVGYQSLLGKITDSRISAGQERLDKELGDAVDRLVDKNTRNATHSIGLELAAVRDEMTANALRAQKEVFSEFDKRLSALQAQSDQRLDSALAEFQARTDKELREVQKEMEQKVRELASVAAERVIEKHRVSEELAQEELRHEAILLKGGDKNYRRTYFSWCLADGQKGFYSGEPTKPRTRTAKFPDEKWAEVPVFAKYTEDPRPLKLGELHRTGALTDFRSFWGLALNLHGDNDRLASAVDDLDLASELFEEFKVLAPVWAEEGLLLP